MPSQFLRLLLLAGLFAGCLVVAFPPFSISIEMWSLDELSAGAMKASTPAKQLSPGPPPSVIADHAGQAWPRDTTRPQRDPPGTFAFNYEEPTATSSRDAAYPVQPTSAVMPRPRGTTPERGGSDKRSGEVPVIDPQDLIRWQRWLQDHGAQQIVVEQIDSHYQCRCLLPLPGSVYEKAFAAEDSHPVRAMQAVLEQVKMWQARHSGGAR